MNRPVPPESPRIKDQYLKPPPPETEQTDDQYLKPVPPQTVRGRSAYLIWNNLPRFVLLAMAIAIVALGVSIREQKNIIADRKAAEIKQQKPPVNVVTLAISPAVMSDRINLPGSVEPWTRLMLLAKISGTVVEVLATEGDQVKTGDVLARIEDADYRIAMERAKAAYELARAEYERDKSIYDKGVIPTSTLDTNKTMVQTTQADYRNAQLMLSRTTVISPMDGVIRRMDAKVGLQLSVGDPIAEILELNRMKAIIGIPESDVTAVRHLEKVELTIQALDDKKIIASKHFLSPSPETAARLYNLELEIDNRGGEILAGMFVRADVVKDRIDNGLAVPFYSVISRNDEQFVFVEEDGLAKKRGVSLGIMENWLVQVTAGLKPGDKVLIEGHRDVEDGQRIKVIKTFTDPQELRL